MSNSSAKEIKRNKILKEVINNSWSGIGIIDHNSRFIYVSEAFKPILGYSEKELLHLNFKDLLLPKFRSIFQELLQKNLKNKYTNNIQVECLRKDGVKVYLDISIKLMSNKKYIVINASDITQSISDHEMFDKYVIKVHVDKNGIIVDASEAFCRLSLYKKEELIGQSFEMMVYENINPDIKKEEIWEDIQTKKQYNGILATKNKRGDIFWVDIIIKPIYNKYGDIVGYSAVMFDMTNEISLKENTKRLKVSLDENEAKLQVMGDTLRTVAHEWRQPLNNISLEAQNLLISYQFSDEGVSKDEAIPLLESMRDNIEGLSQVISKFQLITEIKGDKQEVKLFDVANRALIDANIDKSLLKTDFRDNILFYTYEKELVSSIAAILTNSYEALLKVQNQTEKFIEYKLFLSDKKDMINISISNNGGNIPDDIIEKIFDAYFSTKEVKNGVGLSLYIAKMIIELHLKGKITVQNKPNNIVTFTITLPIG